MAIDATITGVEMHANGTATILLTPAEGTSLPKGQSTLIVVNPPAKDFDVVVGCHIEARSAYGAVFMNGIKWASREGFLRLSLVPRSERKRRGVRDE